MKSIPLYIIVDSWLPRPLLFYVAATSLAKPEISDLLSSTIVVDFLACWNYWILIRRACDLSVGAALQPEMRTTSSTTSQQFCLPVARLVWWVSDNCWFQFQINLEPVPELLSRWNQFSRESFSRNFPFSGCFIKILCLSTRIIDTFRQYFYFDTITHSLFCVNQSSHRN